MVTPRPLLLTALVLLVACSSVDEPKPTLVSDAGLYPDWIVEPPELHGFNPHKLALLHEYAMTTEARANSILIIRHGVLVAEWYSDGKGPDDLVTSWSSAKSITASLVAMAVAQGLIPSLDEPLATYIPEWKDDARAEIRIRDALNMASGLGWSEAAGFNADLTLMSLSADQLAYALTQTMEFPPGKEFYYSSGTTMLFSRVLAAATGMQAEQYMLENLVEPLGFSQFEWWRDGGGNTLAYCCIDATPRDFAKIGQLYMQKGLWNGRQLLPQTWVEAVWEDEAPNPSYALHFWRNRAGGHPDRPTLPRSLVSAQGHDGQYLFMLPEQDLLVVRHALFKRPDGEPVAPDGLFEAGMFLEGLGPTGTRGPGRDSFGVTTFLEMVLAAIEP